MAALIIKSHGGVRKADIKREAYEWADYMLEDQSNPLDFSNSFFLNDSSFIKDNISSNCGVSNSHRLPSDVPKVS